jgi:hypothetical protein
MEIEKDMEYVYRASDMGQGKELEAKIDKLVKNVLMYNLDAKITGLFPIVRKEWPYALDILDRKGIDKPQFLGELCGLSASEVNKVKTWHGPLCCQVALLLSPTGPKVEGASSSAEEVQRLHGSEHLLVRQWTNPRRIQNRCVQGRHLCP